MKLEIIAEVHPQHGGDRGVIREMIRAAAASGADVAKFQLYTASELFDSNAWDYLEFDEAMCRDVKRWCDQDQIEFMASIFGMKQLEMCERLEVQRYKIASRTVRDDRPLCEAILALGKPTIISLGMWDSSELPFGRASNIDYLYCKSAYPAFMEDIDDFPGDFPANHLAGYSDHTLGLDACLLAVARGARIIEKHYTLNKLGGKPTEKAHICSMYPSDIARLRNVGDSLLRAYRLLARPQAG